MKKSFVIYNNWAQMIEELAPDMAGELIKTICHYALTGEVREADQTVQAIFSSIRPIMDQDAAKYEAKVERIRKLNETKSERNRDDIVTKSTRNRDEIVGVNVNDNVNVNVYKYILTLYSETCVSFPRVQSLSEARKKAIKARLNNYSVDDFKKLFEMAEQSDFLKGKNDRNWIASFDWLIKDANMAKVLDGNYANRKKKTKAPDFPQNDYDFAELEKQLISN